MKVSDKEILNYLKSQKFGSERQIEERLTFSSRQHNRRIQREINSNPVDFEMIELDNKLNQVKNELYNEAA